MAMKQFFSSIIFDVFLASLAVFLLSFLIEQEWKGAVVQWVNLNYVLVICLVSGILAILFPKEVEKDHPGAGYWIGSVFISIAAGFIAYKHSEELGVWAYAFACGVSLIIFFISYVLAKNNETDTLENI
ncbi:hypothetical protein HY621_02245 [Candidatus Uhrbacteria bacterium]|nr:hypothetical protein [Candidatus Uhrbacteria bacterium]